MAKLYMVVNKREADPDYYFHCPGCGCDHGIWTTPGSHPVWGFNGDVEKPTFTPSIKVTYQTLKLTNICHSFVTEGKIKYLNDCTHELKGQTVELPDIEKQ